MGDVNINSQADADAFASTFLTCDTLPGDLTVSGFNINDLSGFNEVDVILGTFHWVGNYPGPHDFTGFQQLTGIGGDFHLASNQRLYSFQGLNNLARIDGDLSVGNCDSLLNFSGLGALSVIGGDVIVSGVAHMLDLNGLGQLDTVMGSISLTVGNELGVIAIPDDLDHVGGSLGVYAPAATNMTGGNSLMRIGGYLNISNFSLQSISAFNSLSVIGQGLEIAYCPSLTDLGGFASLDTIYGDFLLDFNDALATLQGFPDLDLVADQFYIGTNAQLTAINGFAELDSIGSLILTINDLLVGLGAFDHPIDIDQLQITNNVALSVCNVQAICDQVLSEPFASIVANNMAGCSSLLEIQNSCVSTGMNDWEAAPILLHPNPTTGRLWFEHGTTVAAPVVVLDRMGRIAIRGTIDQGTLDVHTLEPGFYILRSVVDGVLYRLPFVRE